MAMPFAGPFSGPFAVFLRLLSRARIVATAAVASPLLLLSACGGEEERRADDGRTAGGEILPASVSDAMLPLDRLRSQGETIAAPAEGEEPGTGQRASGATPQAGNGQATDSAAAEQSDEVTAGDGPL